MEQKNRSANRSASIRRIAICGIFGAMCVALLYFGSVVSVLSLSMVIFCAVLTMMVRIEYGPGICPWTYVASTSALALLLLPSQLLAVEYLFLGGIYPIVKALFEKFPKPVAWILKVSFIDLLFLAEYVVTKLILVSEEARFDLTIPTLLTGTWFAVIYDIALSIYATFYIVKLRKKLGLKKLF